MTPPYYGPPLQAPNREVTSTTVVLSTLWGMTLYWDSETEEAWWE